MSLFAELKRRNVFRAAVAYLVFGWLVLQIADVVFPALQLPTWSITLVTVLIGIGLIAVLIFSWVYELTAEGLKRESEVDRSQSITSDTGRRLNLVTVVLVVLAIGVVALDRFMLQPGQSVESQSAVDSEESTTAGPGEAVSPAAPDELVVAVLPFKATGSDDGGFLASGLHDDLLTRLAKLGAFRVISRTSMMEYANTTKNMRLIGDELAAGYILEGGVQAMGARVRINAQLIDAQADEHIWAEVYDRELTASNLFDVQAELAVAIADALQTQLTSSDLALVREVPTRNMGAYNAYLRGLKTYETTGYVGMPKEREAVAAFEEAVRLDPRFALAWAGLATARIRVNDPELEDAVLEALEKARALQPGMLETKIAWAEYLYRFRAEYDRALEILEGLGKRVEGNVYALQLAAWLNRRLGRYETAYRTLLAALRLQPRSPSIYVDLILHAWTTGDCHAAGDFVGQLETLAPDEPSTRVRLAEYELECTGNARRAVHLVKGLDFALTGGWEGAWWAGWHARDAAFLLSLTDTEFVDPGPWVPIWMDLNRAAVYRYIDPDPARADAALDRAAELMIAAERGGAPEEIWEFAAAKASYHALKGDADRTQHWTEEVKRRFRNEFKGDLWQEAQNRVYYARDLAYAGLEDEAVEELRVMLEEPGGHRFTYFDGAIPFDALSDHPEYVELRHRFGSRQ